MVRYNDTEDKIQQSELLNLERQKNSSFATKDYSLYFIAGGAVIILFLVSFITIKKNEKK